jgi:dTDP-4-dehydrorhamnose reductase
MKKTVLIVGISSFIGSNLATQLRDQYRIVGTYFKNPVDVPGITCIPCDVLRKDYVSKLISILKPDFTIYAVGMSSLKECKLNVELADALNTVGAINVCIAAERNGSKFIYLSSCFVLGGEDQLYKEGEVPFPNTVYGTTLSATEFFIQRSCLNYLILRCCPIYGRSYGPHHPNWFEAVQSHLVQGKPIFADESVVTGFMDVVILARLLKALLASDVTNRLFQISTTDHLTRFEFAHLLAKIFHKDGHLIQRISGAFPAEKSNTKTLNKVLEKFYYKMDTSNIEDFLNLTLPSIEDSLQLTWKRLTHYRDEFLINSVR